MKGVGTIATMGVVYWLAMGAAVALLLSIVIGVLVAIAAVVLIVQFLAACWDEATTKGQKASLVAAPAVGLALAGITSTFFTYKNFLLRTVLDLDEHFAELGWVFPVAAVVSIAAGAVSLWAITSSPAGATRWRRGWPLVGTLAATVALAFVVNLGMLSPAEARIRLYDSACEEKNGETVTYGLGGSGTLDRLYVTETDGTAVIREDNVQLPWSLQVAIGSSGDCATVRFHLRSEDQENGMQVRCIVNFGGAAIMDTQFEGVAVAYCPGSTLDTDDAPRRD